MGFTGLGDRLFGSGHPDSADPGGEPANVGVITSTDQGRTRKPVALSARTAHSTSSPRARHADQGVRGR